MRKAAAKLREKYRAEADRYKEEQKELETKARELEQKAETRALPAAKRTASIWAKSSWRSRWW